MSSTRPLSANRYGHFSEDGTEYVVTDPRPPRPWANIIANERVRLAVSHTGSGFSWIDNSQLGTVTRWQQDFASNRSGKFVYVRDAADGSLWSLSPGHGVWSRAYEDPEFAAWLFAQRRSVDRPKPRARGAQLKDRR